MGKQISYMTCITWGAADLTMHPQLMSCTVVCVSVCVCVCVCVCIMVKFTRDKHNMMDIFKISEDFMPNNSY